MKITFGVEGYFFVEYEVSAKHDLSCMIKKEMKEILDFLLSIIYPDVCGFCGKIDKNSLCKECEKNLSSILIYNIEKKYDKYFEKHIYLAKYDGEFRNKILSYKFYEKAYLYKTFSKLFIKNEKICEIIRKL